MANSKQDVNELPGMAPVKPQASGSSRHNISRTERIVSAAGGALLTTIGARQGSWLVATLGGYLMFRGASGFCPINELTGRDTAGPDQTDKSLDITQRVTVSKPRSEVYQYWRQLENLSQFMHHLESVTQLDDKRSHWVAKIADNALANALGKIEWDADIVEEEENTRLVWQSVPGASWDNAGEVRFVDAANGGGTEVYVKIHYTPPVGDIGAALAQVLNPTFRTMIQNDISRFKEIMEADRSTGKGEPGYSIGVTEPAVSSQFGSFDQPADGQLQTKTTERY